MTKVQPHKSKRRTGPQAGGGRRPIGVPGDQITVNNLNILEGSIRDGVLDRDDVWTVKIGLGCGSVPGITTGNLDNLEVLLCRYFRDHEDRPDSDENTENDENYYWGEWVVDKVDQVLNSIVMQLNDQIRKVTGIEA